MKHKKPGTWFMMGGLLLMAAALLLTLYNVWDERRAAASAEDAAQALENALPEAVNPSDPEEQEIPAYILDPDREMPATEIDGNSYIGTLTISCLGLELPVMETWSYPKLRVAPCRYSGSAYKDDMIIAAHNYRTHFGKLKNLRPGDEVQFTDTEGNVFRYTVEETETLDKYAVEEMESGSWDLTLFTCTYGGQSRVTVRCQKVPE